MAARGSRRRLLNGAAAFQSFEVGEGLEKQAQTGTAPERRDID